MLQNNIRGVLKYFCVIFHMPVINIHSFCMDIVWYVLFYLYISTYSDLGYNVNLSEMANIMTIWKIFCAKSTLV